MLVTAFRSSAGYVHIGNSIQVQCRIRTCKLQHSRSVPDTYMYVTAFRFSVGNVHVGYSIPVQCRLRTCKLQHSGSVLDTYMLVTAFGSVLDTYI
jgi:hypothetical protein